MSWWTIAIAISLAVPDPEPAANWTGRIIDETALHVGVRPAVDLGTSWYGAGLTIQITTEIP